jgi:SNF2 family DNA or RNA helicase
MGLGKTIQTLAFIASLAQNHIGTNRPVSIARNAHRCHVGPFMVVVPLTTVPNWQREAAMFTPQLNVVAYMGNADARATCRRYEVRRASPVTLTAPS